jgi:hypothetical protein
MAGASISHVLIVAGPSGAGKSAFLSELAAGRLPQEIACHLPDGSHTWREVFSNAPADWRPLLRPNAGTEQVSGITVHYDVTLMWTALDRALERDPFWDVLKSCEAVTVINIRPTRKRLLRQWIYARLGVRRLWAAHCQTLCSASYATALLRLRARFAGRDLGLLRCLREQEESLERRIRKFNWFHFYRGPGNVKRMMRSWNRVAARKLSDLPVTHIEIAPHRGTTIALAPRWRVVRVAAAARTSVHSTVMSAFMAMTSIC